MAIGIRRPVGDILYSIYLVSLVVGLVAVLPADEVGEFGVASSDGRAVLTAAVIAAIGLNVVSSARGVNCRSSLTWLLCCIQVDVRSRWVGHYAAH